MSESERLEGEMLLPFKMEEGATDQGMQVPLEAEKSRETISLKPSKGMQP